MIILIRTNSENTDFIKLVTLLDADLKFRDGEDHAFYAQFNKIDKIKYAVIAYENEIAIGCGAFRKYSSNTVEVKRMYVSENTRGKGIATQVLSELEKWAGELNYTRCVLETERTNPKRLHCIKKTGIQLLPTLGNMKRWITAYVSKRIYKQYFPRISGYFLFTLSCLPYLLTCVA
jgi:putative acetyltransferase